MKQFKTIFKYEFLGIVASKLYIGLTVALILVIAISLSIPSLINLFDKGGESGAVKKSGDILIIDDNKLIPADIWNSGIVKYNFIVTDLQENSIQEMQEAVKEGAYAAGLELRTLSEYTLYINTSDFTSTLSYDIDGFLSYYYKLTGLAGHGLSSEEAANILNAAPAGEVVELGKSFTSTFLYAYLLLMLLYMSVTIYGQMVASSVATEKSSRTMELLISSAKPTNLMFGKILGSGCAGLMQLLLLIASAAGAYKLNSGALSGIPMVRSMFDMPLDILLYTVIFFILGFFLYAFIYGALGSLVSRVEDLNTSVLPITFLLIAAFMVAMFCINNPGGALIKAASYIPFFAPMCMFLRICMTTVPAWEIAISIGLLALTTVLIGYLSAKIYRIGVLMYGKPPKLSEVLKVMKSN